MADPLNPAASGAARLSIRASYPYLFNGVHFLTVISYVLRDLIIASEEARPKAIYLQGKLSRRRPNILSETIIVPAGSSLSVRITAPAEISLYINMAEPQKKTVSRTRIALVMLATVVFIGVVVLFALLADEVFTIPYLTPVAKFLAMVLSPFIPLIFPIYLGIFLKVCAYPKTNWPGKTRWVAITAMWGFSHTQRAVQNIWKVWGRAFKGNGIESICGLDKCKAAWAEEALTVLVIIAHMRGWSWDNDLFTRWVEGLVKQEKIALENAKRKDSAQQMEKGEVAVEDQIVDSEKSELMAKDGIVLEKEKPLVEIEEEQFDENLRLEI